MQECCSQDFTTVKKMKYKIVVQWSHLLPRQGESRIKRKSGGGGMLVIPFSGSVLVCRYTRTDTKERRTPCLRVLFVTCNNSLMDKTESLGSPDGYSPVVVLFPPKIAQPIDHIASFFFSTYFNTTLLYSLETSRLLDDFRSGGTGPSLVSWTERYFFWDGHACDGSVLVCRYTRTDTKERRTPCLGVSAH